MEIEIKFHNKETGTSFYVYPPQIRFNYTNNWVAMTSGGYTRIFETGDEICQYMHENNFKRVK